LSIDPWPKPQRVEQPPAAEGSCGLAPYAAEAGRSRGRLVPEPPSPTRTPFQRDRDRILHSTAFRRLTYKTQVFVYHEGDHYRTRLTHSLEVAQIARSMARTLRVDEDLTEALALAHDLGHPPFGHAGERALDIAMRGEGGFDHNAQGLRVVTELERKYPEFDGLNLSWETLEGLVKHNGPLLPAKARPVPASILSYCERHDLELQTYPSLEAQLASLADDIAYNNHDIEDGFRARMFSFDELAEVPIAGHVLKDVRAAYPGLGGPRFLYEAIRKLITTFITDAVAETDRRLAELKPTGADDIRRAGRPMVAFSAGMEREVDALRGFLRARVYKHPRIERIMGDAEKIVGDLFAAYRASPEALPAEWRPPGTMAANDARHICDFIAGMTDRYAIAEHRRLFDATPELR
jgi:dGTPase